MEKYRPEFDALRLADDRMPDDPEAFRIFCRMKEAYAKGRESVKSQIQKIRQVVSEIEGAHSVIIFIRKEVDEGEQVHGVMCTSSSYKAR
jgi:cell fate (sporulation/competence/biofilm development) regulator YlbF (YheA/YmcA/DUF963 family)